mgnify:FL=1
MQHSQEFNHLFDKFILSIKDELYDRFIKFTDYDKSENREKCIEMVTQHITTINTTSIKEEPEKKRGRGRPKKKIDSIDDSKNLESTKRGRGRPKKESAIDLLKVTVVNDTDDDNDIKKRGRPQQVEKEIEKKIFNNETSVEEEESIDVIRIEIEGNVYLRDGNNKLYNMDDQEYIGLYNEQNGTIVSS